MMGVESHSHLPRPEKHSGQAELVVILIQSQSFEQSLQHKHKAL